jgi:hypothetical protein
MGVQIPCGVHSQVPQEDALRGVATTSRGSVSQAGDAKGKQSRGRPSDAGSRSHDDLDPPKYAVSQVIGYIKGKSAIHLSRVYGERKRNFTGQHFWASRSLQPI